MSNRITEAGDSIAEALSLLDDEIGQLNEDIEEARDEYAYIDGIDRLIDRLHDIEDAFVALEAVEKQVDRL